MVVGWATSREIADGLLIVDKDGNKKHLTAPRRTLQSSGCNGRTDVGGLVIAREAALLFPFLG